MASAFFITRSVRSSEDASGRLTWARRYPWSSSGMKPAGTRFTRPTISTVSTPMKARLRTILRTRIEVNDT